MNVQLGSTVVVGVDGSADGRRALRYAVSLASSDKLPLRLVHVCEETVYAPVLMYLPAQSIEAIGRRILRGARDEAERLGVEASRLSSVLMRGSRPAALVGH